jgi:hypothetical protein
MARNRGQFGTVERSITDHFKTLLLASEILAAEHGTRHQPGERADLCPKCKAPQQTEPGK